MAGSANISNYAYTYDTTTHRPGRQSEVSQIAADPTQVRAYGYDDVDQLTSETVSQNGQTVSQSTSGYDPMGNRTGAQSTSATSQSTSSYTPNKLNQLIALSTTTGTDTAQSTLGYDQSGNLTSVSSGASGTSYSYDDANRLSAVEVAGQSKSTFLYDGFSRLRVSRDFAWQNGAWVQTGEVRRVYDGMDVVQERDAQNQPVCTYTRSGNIGGILARTDANGYLYYHYDGRGNVSQLTNSTAQVAARYGYDAFGNTSASGTAAGLNRYRFSTKEQIGGLYSYGYRFYSSSMGRWLNRDPIEERGGLNIYEFVSNNPVNELDAYGYASIIRKPIAGPIYSHSHLWFKGVCSGQKTAGFHSNGGIVGKPGIIKIPDPSYQPGVGTHLYVNNDPRFEAALCQCVKQAKQKESIGQGPNYNLASSNCGRWSFDMWECAKRTLGWREPDYGIIKNPAPFAPDNGKIF